MQPQPQLSNPYAAPAARVSDVAEETDLVLADRGTRLAAVIIDGLMFGGLAFVMAIIFALVARKGTGYTGFLGFIFIAAFVALIVVNMVLLHRHGQTIAKRLFKIKIVRTDGSRCGLLRVIFLRVLPINILGGIVGFLLIALGPFGGYIVSLIDALLIFRSDYRCLHDHIADTIVVKA